MQDIKEAIFMLYNIILVNVSLKKNVYFCKTFCTQSQKRAKNQN